MIEEYCKNCGKVTGHKRTVGMGTFLGACLTLGVSLAATPFYPKRCVVCGCKSEPPRMENILPRTPEQIQELSKRLEENNPMVKLVKFINDKMGEDMKK